jgi:hypothetical protein
MPLDFLLALVVFAHCSSMFARCKELLISILAYQGIIVA